MQFIKREYKKISLIIVVTLIFSLITAQNILVEATKREVTEIKNIIKILEIEPGNRFYLTNETVIANIPRDEIMTYNNQTIHITHVTMAEYISLVSEVSGQYDIIVVGRDRHNLSTVFQNPNDGSNKVYRDYTNPLSQLMPNLPLTYWGKVEPNFTTIDGNFLAEYYSENDITEKRAKEIMAMIDTSQLVYMDEAIFNEEITSTKLYNLFVDKSGENLVKTHYSKIKLDLIMDKYNSMDEELKRPKVEKVTNPLDDSKNDGDSVGRNMEFGISLKDEISEKITVNLYLDINADGLYKDKELVRTFEVNPKESQEINLDYTLNSDFVGHIDWKIDLVRENGVKTSLYGNSQYKSLYGTKKVKVLQIVPYTDQEMKEAGGQIVVNDVVTKNIKLNNHEEFQKLLEQVTDYEIEIHSVSLEDFNKYVGTDRIESDLSNIKGNNVRYILNGNYNMVIIGFSDSYGFKQFNEKAVDELEGFISTGQSVMFTHDTITPSISNGYGNTGPKLLSQRFRDYVGQSRYIDPYRDSELDIYKEEVVTRDQYGNIVNVELVDKTIPHDVFNVVHEGNTVSTLGATLQGYIGGWIGNIDTVVEVNSAQINNYPFELTKESKSISVSKTHTQWYQLNLEDEDVVPWFNLSSNRFDSGDSRNNYYTYSKGNITYSGTGHTSEKFPDSELKLFINTIVKAERSSNHAPTLELLNLDDILMHENQEKHDYIIVPSDLDRDLMDIEIQIYGIKDSGTRELLTEKVLKNKVSDEGFSESVINTDRTKFMEYNQVEVNVTATDILGAKSETVVKTIDIVDEPILEVTLGMPNGVNGYLMGEQAVLEASFNKTVLDTTTGYSNLEFKLTNPNELNKILNLSGSNNVEFDSLLEESVTGTFRFNVGTDSNISENEVLSISNINGSYSYRISSNDTVNTSLLMEGNRTSSINIKRGQVKVKVFDAVGSDITRLVTAKLINTSGIEVATSSYSNGVMLFDNIITGNYQVKLDTLPTGYVITEEQATKNVSVSYDYNVAECSFEVDGTTPNINAYLQGSNPEIVAPGHETTVTYRIKGEDIIDYDFGYGTDGGKIDEAIFVLDLSKKMNDNQRWSQFQNGITNSILNDIELSDMRFGVIGYNNPSIVSNDTYVGNLIDSGQKSFTFNNTTSISSDMNPLFELNDGNKKDCFRQLFQEGHINGKISSNESSNANRNITNALKLADEILTTKGGANKNKAIILINAGEVKYSSEEISNIKSKGYKIISVDLSGMNQSDESLKSLHSILGGGKLDYFIGTAKDSEGNNNTVNTDMGKVAESLKQGIGYPTDDIIVNTSLNFDLGDKLSYVSNSLKINNQSVNEEDLLTILETENRIAIDKIEVVYVYDETNNTNDVFKADDIYVSFNVEVDSGIIDNEVSFRNRTDKIYNNLSYVNFMDKSVVKLVDTPIIKIYKPSNLIHGLYNGKNNGNGDVIIEQNQSGFDMVGSMYATFGSACIIGGRGTKITLELDPGLVKNSGIIIDENSTAEQINLNEVKVYRAESNNNSINYVQIKEEKLVVKRVGSVYTIIINENLPVDTKVFISYTAEIPEVQKKETLTNTIKVNELEADVKINIGIPMPDLF